MTAGRSAARPRLTLVLLVLSGPLGSCGGGLDESRLSSNRSSPFVEAGAQAGVEAGQASDPCPDDPPKVGERCPTFFDETMSCTYVVGECQTPTARYAEYLNYCCVRQLWTVCGGMSACDTAEKDASLTSAADGPTTSASADALRDGARDGSPDAGADAPVDAAGPDGAPGPDGPAGL